MAQGTVRHRKQSIITVIKCHLQHCRFSLHRLAMHGENVESKAISFVTAEKQVQGICIRTEISPGATKQILQTLYTIPSLIISSSASPIISHIWVASVVP